MVAGPPGTRGLRPGGLEHGEEPRAAKITPERHYVGDARPSTLTEERRDEIERVLAAGAPLRIAAASTGVSERSLSRWLQEGRIVRRSLSAVPEPDPPAAGADRLRTAIGRACRAAGVPAFSPHDLRHRRISLLHRQGRSWAEIARFVGQRKLSITADTYTHVLLDGRELSYDELVA